MTRLNFGLGRNFEYIAIRFIRLLRLDENGFIQ